MTNARIIFEATKIIDNHITSPLSIADLAEKVGYSQYYFIRLFAGIVGCLPKEYQVSRRLSRAAKEVVSGEKKIIDIAYRYQFKSPEAFSRAFKKFTCYSPSEFKKIKNIKDVISKLPWIAPYYQDISDSFESCVKREPEIVYLDEMLLAGKAVKVEDDYSCIGKLWSELSNIKPPNHALNPLQYAQYSYWYRDDSVTFYTMASFVVSQIDQDNILLYKKIPKAKYLRFPHYGKSEMVSDTYYWLYSNWLPSQSIKLSFNYNLEMYTEEGSEEAERGISAWILIPIE